MNTLLHNMKKNLTASLPDCVIQAGCRCLLLLPPAAASCRRLLPLPPAAASCCLLPLPPAAASCRCLLPLPPAAAFCRCLLPLLHAASCRLSKALFAIVAFCFLAFTINVNAQTNTTVKKTKIENDDKVLLSIEKVQPTNIVISNEKPLNEIGF